MNVEQFFFSQHKIAKYVFYCESIEKFRDSKEIVARDEPENQ